MLQFQYLDQLYYIDIMDEGLDIFDQDHIYLFHIISMNFSIHSQFEQRLIIELYLEYYLKQKEMEQIAQDYIEKHGGAEQWITLN